MHAYYEQCLRARLCNSYQFSTKSKTWKHTIACEQKWIKKEWYNSTITKKSKPRREATTIQYSATDYSERGKKKEWEIFKERERERK